MSERIKNYLVSPEVIGEFCRTRTLDLKIQGVPVDADFKAAHWDLERRCFCVTFGHPTFDEVDSGRLIPEGKVTVGTSPSQRWRIGRKYRKIMTLQYPDGSYAWELGASCKGSSFADIDILWVDEGVFQLEWLGLSGDVIFKVEMVPPVTADRR